MGKYAYLILAVAFSTALFEVFYNWLRIQLYSVFGNFLKEFFPRALIFTLLLIYAFGGLDLDGFIMALILGYYLRLVWLLVLRLLLAMSLQVQALVTLLLQSYYPQPL